MVTLSEPSEPRVPFISVVIATRGRPAELDRTLHALLECAYSDFEIVLIVDGEDAEPDGPQLEQMLRGSGMRRTGASAPAKVCSTASTVVYRLRSRISLLYTRVPWRGAAAARNAGIRLARGEVIALTDDDCTPPRDWLKRFAQQLSATPAPGLVCGALRAAPHDPTQTYVPVFEPASSTRIHGRFVRPWQLGVSANMAGRRETLARLGGFDERLGVGTTQRSGEDAHLVYRALRAGLDVQLDPANSTLHWGGRSHADGSAARLLTDSWFGMGACYGLLLGEGDPAAAVIFSRELRANLAGQLLARARRRRPTQPLAACAMAGFWRGLRLSRVPAPTGGTSD